MDHDLLEWKPRFAARAPARLPTAPQPQPVAAQRAAHRRLACARLALRQTMARSTVPEAVRPRITAFDGVLQVAMRLVAELPASDVEAALPGAPASGCSIDDLVGLAHRAIDRGRLAAALSMLAGIGALLGGTPRAAFETALGLLRAGRDNEAREFLVDAVKDLHDPDGVAQALLAQLHFEAGDERWLILARRVVAVGTDADARERCHALLAAAGAS